MQLQKLTRAAGVSDDDAADWVRDRIDTDMATGCEVWTGKTVSAPVRKGEETVRNVTWPVLGMPGRSTEHVRRFWWSHNHPEETEDTMRGYRVRRDPASTCHELCVNPEHMLVEPAPGYSA